MLRWWTVLLYAITCHAPPAAPPTPRQRATEPRVMSTHRYDIEDDFIEGDLVHPEGIID